MAKFEEQLSALFTPEQEAEIVRQDNKRGRPRKDDLVREGVQAGLSEEYTRATFILKVELLEELKNYAYTERLNIKDAVNELLQNSLEAWKEKGGVLLDRNSRRG